jgi:hypothetical protein
MPGIMANSPQEGITMRYPGPRQLLLTLALLVPLATLAEGESQPLESDWLQLVKGYRDPASGVEMRDVEYGEEAGTRTVTLAIPKKSMANPADIEEVVVVGRRPEKPEPLDISYEWLDDYDNDNYGLVIRLGRNSNWPIRLYLNSAPGFINN